MRKVLFLMTLLPLFAWAQPAGYNYGKQILIDHTKVEGTTPLTNFSVLVSFTDADLRSTANGGHVENSNGYDIAFTTSDCATLLDHQIEKYNATTGELIAWVKIPSLPTDIDYNMHMYYGNSSVTANPSTTSVWHSEVRAVYHLSNNDFSDGTANGMNGTNSSTGNITGKIGDARSFDGTQAIRVVDNGSTSLDVTTLTMSAWVYPTNYSTGGGSHRIIINKENAYEVGLANANGRLQAAINPSCWRWAGTDVIALNTWSKITIVVVGGIQKHYVNGTFIEQFNDCSNPISINNHDLKIGARGGDGGTYSFFTGNIDEVKIVGREETADWIKTEYNNQNAPSSFYSVSTEKSAASHCALLPIELINFEATAIQNEAVKLRWQTASEINNDYFTLERSYNAEKWETIKTIKGAGNSANILSYTSLDKQPYNGTSYYRLKQTDFDGQYSYSDIQAVNIENAVWSKVRIFPNPSQNELTIVGNKQEIENYHVYDILGNNLSHKVQVIESNENQIRIDLSQLQSGMYFIKTKTAVKRWLKQ